MHVLSVNCGSSTLRFDLFSVDDRKDEQRLARGVVERIGGTQATLEISDGGSAPVRQSVTARDHSEAMRLVLTSIETSGIVDVQAITAAIGWFMAQTVLSTQQ